MNAVTFHLRGIFDNPPINHVVDPQAIPRGRKDPHPFDFAFTTRREYVQRLFAIEARPTGNALAVALIERQRQRCSTFRAAKPIA